MDKKEETYFPCEICGAKGTIQDQKGGVWCGPCYAKASTPPIKYDSPKIRRNDPCPCGSGIKFKKCTHKK